MALYSYCSIVVALYSFGLNMEQGGGCCANGQAASPTGHLVIIDGSGGLQQRLDADVPLDIPVAPGKRLSPVIARENFAAWLIPRGLLPRYHIFVSYRSMARWVPSEP